MENPGLINWGRIILVGLIWGGAFMAVKIALDGFQPLTLAAGRILIGACALYMLLKLRGGRLPPLHDRTLWRFILAIGILSSALPFALLSWGQQYVPSAFAGMTMAALPIFVLPLAHFFVPGDRMSWRKSFAFGIGFIGTTILVGTGGLGEVDGTIELVARTVCIMAAFCYAVGSIVTRLCPEVDQLALSTAALLVSTIVMVPIALIVEGVPPVPPLIPLSALIYLGLVPTAVAFIIKVAVIRSAGPSFMTLTNYQVPVWSVLFGYFFMQEALPPQLFLALILILSGIALSQWSTLKRIFFVKTKP
ncbi:DMT family transporter [Pseudaestuariivita rosea]|uniref:DMT family transporter n=1 Tax=Pseudaestuariivita rosea TaxID=2763263 RepID=UPI001F2EAE6F|nr:DMT family transporter [Pseudaestuariivita rosea]